MKNTTKQTLSFQRVFKGLTKSVVSFQVRVISHIFIHPGYIDTGFVNDISILRMEEPVRFTDYIRPVCLPPPTADIRDGRLCTVVGWGQLYETGRVFRKHPPFCWQWITVSLFLVTSSLLLIIAFLPSLFANSRHPTASSVTSSLDRRVPKTDPLPSSISPHQQHVLRRFRSRRTWRLSGRFRRPTYVRGNCSFFKIQLLDLLTRYNSTLNLYES